MRPTRFELVAGLAGRPAEAGATGAGQGRPAEAGPTGTRPGRLARVALAACAFASGLAVAGPVLLPPERAFALSARALDAKTVEVRFQVTDGYYLYRDKIAISVEPPARVGKADIPAGKVVKDEFFGDVATLRGSVGILVPVTGAKPGTPLRLVVESQGCSPEHGVCFPPARQTLALDVPAAGAAPGPPVPAVGAKKAWLQ